MKKLLVVVDMQKDFVDGALRNEQGMQIVNNVADKIRQYKDNKDFVVYTQDTHGEDYLDTQEGKNLPVEHCISGSEGWGFTDGLKDLVSEEDQIFRKPTFGSVGLGKYIEEKREEIGSVEVIGLCTDICVLSNAVLIKVFVPEIPICVDAACCAGVTPESHDTAINALKAVQVQIINEGKEPWR